MLATNFNLYDIIQTCNTMENTDRNLGAANVSLYPKMSIIACTKLQYILYIVCLNTFAVS